VNHFDKEAKVVAVRVAVRVKTSHRGDLQILLTGPGGYSTIIQNEEGAGARNLNIAYRDVYVDVSEEFQDLLANGRWVLRFQDRLKGDICTVQSAGVEIEAETPADVDDGGGGGSLDPGITP
jgi:subtilisin-like proprotein convertase family protein